MTKIMGLGVDLGEEQKKKKPQKTNKRKTEKGWDDLTDSVELQNRTGEWGVAGAGREGGKEVKKFLIRETVKIQYENK